MACSGVVVTDKAFRGARQREKVDAIGIMRGLESER